MVFQSTHPYGCDGSSDVLDDVAQAVSIHAPIRVRHDVAFPFVWTSGFNPRTHTGATSVRVPLRPSPEFQSTHPYGCDTRPTRFLSSPSSFNPRTHTGATSFISSFFMSFKFQSTHPYGCDHAKTPSRSLVSGFNPRTHTGATLQEV